MKVKNQSSSEVKATTPARHLVATAIIGAAMIGYLVHKSPEARVRLESLSTMAQPWVSYQSAMPQWLHSCWPDLSSQERTNE